MEIATPAAEPSATATLAEPAIAAMDDVSFARTAMLAAVMPVAPSPSMYALTQVTIRFSAKTPAPLKPTPAVAPAPTATEPATTRAPIDCEARASMVRSPVVPEIDVVLTYA